MCRQRWAHFGPRHTAHGVAARQASYAGTLNLVDTAGWTSPAWPTSNANANTTTGLLWNNLLDYDAHGNFFPELAAQVPTLANGGITVIDGNEVITFHLKPALRWSDGSPITAADYIAAILIGTAPEVGTFYPPGSAGYFRAARITGSTLVITLQGIYPEALQDLGFAPGPWEYLQQKYGLALPASLVASFDATRARAMFAAHAYQGSPLQRLILKLLSDPYSSPHDLVNGPYRIVSWSPNGSGVVAPNPYYTALPPDPHHPRPALIRLLTPTGDPNANGRAILAGTLPAHADLVTVGTSLRFIPPPALIRAYPGYRLDLEATSNLELLDLNQANPALRDQRVRQALLYGIDKRAYLRALFHLSAADAATIATTSLFPSRWRFSINNQLPVNLYNPARARALLASAGYAASPSAPGRHLHLDFYTTTRFDRERSGQILRQYWRQIGIDVTLHFIKFGGVGSLFGSYSNGGILAQRHFDIAEYGWSINRDSGLVYHNWVDPGQISDQNNPAGINHTGVRDRTLFSFVDQAQRTLDDGKRRRLYERFQRYSVAHAYAIPLLASPDPIWVKPTIGNFNPAGGNVPWGSDFSANVIWNAFQWYVR